MQVRGSGDELRLGPLGLQEADSENNTKSKKYFQTEMQSNQMLIRCYIARILSQRSGLIAEILNYRSWRSDG